MLKTFMAVETFGEEGLVALEEAMNKWLKTHKPEKMHFWCTSELHCAAVEYFRTESLGGNEVLETP